MHPVLLGAVKKKVVKPVKPVMPTAPSAATTSSTSLRTILIVGGVAVGAALLLALVASRRS